MKKLFRIFFIAAGLFSLAVSCSSDRQEQSAETTPAEVAKPAVETAPASELVSTGEKGGNGEALFIKHCIKCHKNGGNIINAEKTIRRKDLAERNINTAEDIIHVMRNPGKGMMRFSEEKIPDADAKKIGEYILKTFE